MKKVTKHFGKRFYAKFFSTKKSPTIDCDNPFGTSPRADRDTYIRLSSEACRRRFPDMDRYLAKHAYMLDVDWLECLALHTQIVVKHSPLNFQHGRLLYGILRQMLVQNPNLKDITIVETGTARGFSAICLAKALKDADRCGKIVTIDMIPHNIPIYWNCIDDHEGKKTREQLLAPWSDELERVVFLRGDTRTTMDRLGMRRIHFAFLDACHTEAEVFAEYEFVAARQSMKDMIVIDDVTKGLFDGVVAAVDRICEQGLYTVERLYAEKNRGYAIAIRN